MATQDKASLLSETLVTLSETVLRLSCHICLHSRCPLPSPLSPCHLYLWERPSSSATFSETSPRVPSMLPCVCTLVSMGGDLTFVLLCGVSPALSQHL